jgi:ferredoxin
LQTNGLVIACSCEGTMPLHADTLGGHCDGRLRTANQLCRAEIDLFKTALAEGVPVTVGCTQEAPLFQEVAAEMGATAPLHNVDIRGWGGWSDEAEAAGPKMAALLAAEAVPMPAIPLVSLKSEGVVLVYGRDESALTLARRLADHLDVTVLLDRPQDVAPPRANEFPVFQGRITSAKGSLGAFELRVDDFAAPLPSSRSRLVFGPACNGAKSQADIVVDVSGGLPLVPAHEVRPGYLRADPRDPAAIERLAFEASHLVGEFDKPKYVAFHEHLCAHSRSGITGCTRCLSLCPTGAITPAGNSVAIDAAICAGCGSCAAACPTGAASYALPPADAVMTKLRKLVLTYGEAGGRDPVILFHDADHGGPLLDALARFGRGLPSNVIPLRVNEIGEIGPEILSAAFAYGAAGAHLLMRERPKHDMEGVRRTVELSTILLAGLGYGTAVSILQADDPDQLRATLDSLPLGRASDHPASFAPMGTKRGVMTLAMRELYRAAAEPASPIPLPAYAQFGGLEVRTEGCTLCHSCVGACPTNALSDNPDLPMLRFTEELCVQCGLCAATCPENVITLKPQLDIAAWDAPLRVIKQEEPFHCTACAKPFGTRSTIERVVERLSGKHWMFSGNAGEARLRALTMCEDCRVNAMVLDGFDPHNAPPRTRTTEDYLRERQVPPAE